MKKNTQTIGHTVYRLGIDQKVIKVLQDIDKNSTTHDQFDTKVLSLPIKL